MAFAIRIAFSSDDLKEHDNIEIDRLETTEKQINLKAYQDLKAIGILK
ncbi:MAG: hypothetical protein HQK91_15155 [Nitrospirae bacterium]|nr:hypothetical protein [Nitrospirota bacterium]